MCFMKRKVIFQRQKEIRELNENKILKALIQHGSLSFTEILKITDLSRPVLTTHLKRMIREGKITRGFGRGLASSSGGKLNKYYISSRKYQRIHNFSSQIPSILTRYEFEDDETWDGTKIYDNEDEVANEFLDNISSLFFFLIKKLMETYQKNDVEERKYLLDLPSKEMIQRIDQYLLMFLEGFRVIVDKKSGLRIQKYYEFDLNLPPETLEARLNSRFEILFKKIRERYVEFYRDKWSWFEELYNKTLEEMLEEKI